MEGGGGFLNSKTPQKNSPLRGENNPKSMVLELFGAPLGAPGKFYTFLHPLAAFSFIFIAI